MIHVVGLFSQKLRGFERSSLCGIQKFTSASSDQLCISLLVFWFLKVSGRIMIKVSYLFMLSSYGLSFFINVYIFSKFIIA
jgi:hypothetical protein